MSKERIDIGNVRAIDSEGDYTEIFVHLDNSIGFVMEMSDGTFTSTRFDPEELVDALPIFKEIIKRIEEVEDGE